MLDLGVVAFSDSAAQRMDCAKYADAFAQDLIDALQLTHLALQLLRTLAFRGRQATAEPVIALGLPDPLPEPSAPRP